MTSRLHCPPRGKHVSASLGTRSPCSCPRTSATLQAMLPQPAGPRSPTSKPSHVPAGRPPLRLGPFPQPLQKPAEMLGFPFLASCPPPSPAWLWSWSCDPGDRTPQSCGVPGSWEHICSNVVVSGH